MKSIIVKYNNSICSFSSGWCTDFEGNEIKRTDDEEWQSVYSNLIEHTRRKDFEKAMESLLTNYLRKKQMDNWTNIEIKISYSDSKHCEMNIGNDNNMKFKEIGLPENLTDESQIS